MKTIKTVLLLILVCCHGALDAETIFYNEYILEKTPDNVAPTFLNLVGVPILNNLEIGSLANIGINARDVGTKIYLLYEWGGSIDRSDDLAIQKINSQNNNYTHLSKNILPITTQSIKNYFYPHRSLFEVSPIKEGSRLKIIQEDNNSVIESPWYTLERKLTLQNFRFTDNKYIVNWYPQGEGSNVRDFLEVYDDELDKVYFREWTQISSIEGTGVTLYLVGDVLDNKQIRSDLHNYNVQAEKIYSNNIPKEIPVEFYVSRNGKIVSNVIEKPITFLENWRGSNTIYVGEINIYHDLFNVEFKQGDQIIAKVNQFFVNTPLEAIVNINTKEEIIKRDCDSDLLGEGTRTNYFNFFTYETRDNGSSKLVTNKFLSVNQDFFVELIVENKEDMCLSGWVEIVEGEPGHKNFYRNRIRVNKIDGNDYETIYRSEKLRFDNDNIPSHLIPDNSNSLYVISSNEEYKKIINNSYRRNFGGSESLLSNKLENGEGLLTVIVKGNDRDLYNYDKNLELSDGKIIITDTDGNLIEKKGQRWEGGLAFGKYQVDYEIMGERIGVKDVEIDKSEHRIINLGGKEYFNDSRMEQSFVTYYGAQINSYSENLKCEYSRNGLSFLGNCIRQQLHVGTYLVSLNSSKDLLFPTPDTQINVVAGKETLWPSPIGVLELKKKKNNELNVIRSAAVIKGNDVVSPLFAFGKSISKLLPVGKYTAEIQEANSTEIITREFEIKPSEVTVVNAEIDEVLGKLSVKSIDKEGYDISFYVNIYEEGGKYVDSWNGKNLTRELFAGMYTLNFDIKGQEVIRDNIVITENNTTEVLVNLSEPEEVKKPNDARIVLLAPGSKWEYTFSDPTNNIGWYIGETGNWRIGEAPFGNQTGTLDPNFNYKTFWESDEKEGDDLWVRKTIDLTGIDLSTIQWGIGVDNGYKLYVNGRLVSSDYADGYAYRWEYTGDFSEVNLKSGKNTISVALEDNGMYSTFDMIITGVKKQ